MNATTVTVSTLQATIARALAHDPAARARIERAAILIGLGAVEKVDERTYRVASQTGDGSTYTVVPGGCTCVDSQRHPGQRCKHAWAVRITLAAQLQECRERFPELTDQEMERLTAWKHRYTAA